VPITKKFSRQKKPGMKPEKKKGASITRISFLSKELKYSTKCLDFFAASDQFISYPALRSVTIAAVCAIPFGYLFFLWSNIWNSSVYCYYQNTQQLFFFGENA
jgi:hypothetical protein